MVCLTHMTERVCVKKLNPHVTCENNGDGNCSIWLTEVYASKKNTRNVSSLHVRQELQRERVREEEERVVYACVQGLLSN